MTLTSLSASAGGLLRVGMEIPSNMSETSAPSGMSMGSSAGDAGGSDSTENFDSTTDKPPHPHHLKLLALSAELMNSPADRTGKESSVVSVGLVEEARNRRRGRKERCVHWDRVEINGREFPLQRADTSTNPSTPAAASTGVGQKPNLIDESDPSYLLVGHSTCDMCLMTFESSSVSGVITMKRIMEARRDWGMAGSGGKSHTAASKFYEPARLCVLCSQFFCSRPTMDGRGEGGLVPCGVGRSDEKVSLSLESMASNKPLPDKAARLATSSPGAQLTRHSIRYGGRRRDANERKQDARSGAHGTVNRRLDELIADDRLVVKATDLARQLGAVATQSSTADGMGADVCMGFPAADRVEGQASGAGAMLRLPRTGTASEMGPAKETTTAMTVWATEGAPSTRVAGSGDNSTTGGSISTSDTTNEAGGGAWVDASSTAVADTSRTDISPPAAAAAAAAAARTCSRTRRENQPWWEVDLGGVFPVRCIRVHHPDRRTEATKAGALPFVDVAPFWIMTAAGPIGEAMPEEAREQAIASRRFATHGKVTVWDLGANHFAMAVRVQAEGVKSLQLARVEVIKGGGTQQAKDLIQQQPLAKRAQKRFDSGESGESSCTEVHPTALTRTKSRRVSEHTITLRRLLQFYQERARGGDSSGPPETGPGTAKAATKGAKQPSTAQAVATAGPSSAGAVGGGPGGAGGDAGRLGPTMSGSASQSASSPAMDMVRPPRNGNTEGRWGGGGTGGVGSGGNEAYRLQTRACPVPAGGGFEGLSSAGGDRRSASGHGRRRRRRKVELQGEDVRRLLLRAMVGYDWVDEFNGQEMRVRGAFTEQDVTVLEDIFFRCALGDDVEARTTATLSDQSLRLDPGELCGDLRRLQLQVQTNTGGKSKTPMLLAVRESPNLFQLLSSGVVESLPDALARAEAQLPPAQRPLCLDWTRFLGVMGLCLEGACRGTGTVVPSAVARLFEETHDDKLDFLTRKRSRLPPSRNVVGTAHQHGFASPEGGRMSVGAGGPDGPGSGGGDDVSRATGVDAAISAAGSRATTAGTAGGGGASVAEDMSFREGGSVDTGDDGSPFEASVAPGSRQREEALSSTRVGLEGGGGNTTRRAKGGRSAALKSLLRPQARHEVFRGYGEALSKRRGRQREAFRRAPEPDVEPTRAYKPCGLCQAPFPVESLGATVSLKVLRTFLTTAGAPSERFDRKASSLCSLHRLPLCVFCGQFFDPDFPGGIVPPRGYSANKYRDAAIGRDRRGRAEGRSPPSPVESNHLIPFFDDRFPERWSDTPPPSSAPASVASYGFRPAWEGLPVLASSMAPSTSNGRYKGGRSGAGKHVHEAKGLREVGNLVRGGLSIRDRFLLTPSEA